MLITNAMWKQCKAACADLIFVRYQSSAPINGGKMLMRDRELAKKAWKCYEGQLAA